MNQVELLTKTIAGEPQLRSLSTVCRQLEWFWEARAAPGSPARWPPCPLAHPCSHWSSCCTERSTDAQWSTSWQADVLLEILCAPVKERNKKIEIETRPRYPKLYPKQRLLRHSRDSPVTLFKALVKPFTIYKTHRSNQWFVDQIPMTWPGTWTRMMRAGRPTDRQTDRCCGKLNRSAML